VTVDVVAAAQVVEQAETWTADPGFALGGAGGGDLTGLELWAELAGGDWATVDAATAQARPASLARPPRAAAVVNGDGRAGIVLGFGYVAAPVGRGYTVGPYDPTRWVSAWLLPGIVYTGGR